MHVLIVFCLNHFLHAYIDLIQIYPTFLSNSLVCYSCVTSVTEQSSERERAV
jgi:hypothetical protein